jgi:hypothetical protein
MIRRERRIGPDEVARIVFLILQGYFSWFLRWSGAQITVAWQPVVAEGVWQVRFQLGETAVSAALPLADLSALASGPDEGQLGWHPQETERADALRAIADEMRRALLRLDMLQALGYHLHLEPET